MTKAYVPSVFRGLLGFVLLLCTACTTATWPSAGQARPASRTAPTLSVQEKSGAENPTRKGSQENAVHDPRSVFPTLYLVRTQERAVALTFDDGPDPKNTPVVLQLLARHCAHATFFVLGQTARHYPSLVRDIAAGGNEVANHGMRHVLLTRLGKDRMVAEIGQAQGLLDALSGQAPRYFRPPYGDFDRNVVDAANRVGETLVLWTTDARDWKNPKAQVIAGRVLGPLRPGAIILLHDGGGPRQPTVRALETILQTLHDRGYRAVTLHELVQDGSPVPIPRIPEPHRHIRNGKGDDAGKQRRRPRRPRRPRRQPSRRRSAIRKP